MRKKQKKSCKSFWKALPKSLLKPVPIMVTVIVLLLGVIAVMGIANVVEDSDQMPETQTGIRAAAVGDDFEWIGQYGTSLYDNAEDIFVGNANDIYVIGSTKGALPGQISAGQSDIYFSKYDGNLDNEVWTKQFGTAGIDKGYAITVKDGYIYIVGSVSGSLPGQSSAGSVDAFIRKYDQNGQEVWTRQFGTSFVDELFSVYADATGIYVGGDTAGLLAGKIGGVFIKKYDEKGTEIWATQFGSEIGAKDHISAIYGDLEIDKAIYVTGYTEGTLPDQINAGGTDSFIASFFMADGIEIWTKQFGSTGNDSSTGVFADVSGIYMVGSVVGTLPGQTSAGGVVDAYIKKYDGDGNELWTRQFGTLGNETAADVYKDSSMIYVGGSTTGSFPHFPNAGNLDVYISAYNINGDAAWTTQFGTSDYDLMRGIYFSGTVYAVGETSGAFSGQINAGDRDAWVAKLGAFNTPVGSNILVEPLMGVAKIVFNTVNASGYTSVRLDEAPQVEVPHNFTLIGNAVYPDKFYYRITTTAAHTGITEVSAYYDTLGLSAEDEDKLILMQYRADLGKWIEITTHRNSDLGYIMGRHDDPAVFDNNPFYAIVLPSLEYTPSGEDINVAYDPYAISVIFSSVTEEGMTTFSEDNGNLPAPAPFGYTVYQDRHNSVTTTATISGETLITVEFSTIHYTSEERQNLHLMHYRQDLGIWENITFGSVSNLGYVYGKVIDPAVFNNNPDYAIMMPNTFIGSSSMVDFPEVGLVTYDNVTSSGVTSFDIKYDSLSAPAGYTKINNYELTTTAEHDGVTTIRLEYDPVGLPYYEQQQLRLLQRIENHWIDITSSIMTTSLHVVGKVNTPDVFDNNPIFILAKASAICYTNIGPDQSVTYPDIGTFNFGEVMDDGCTTIIPISASNFDGIAIPDGYSLAGTKYYQISSTAVFNQVDIGIYYSNATSYARLMHYREDLGIWENVSFGDVNTIDHIVTGRVFGGNVFNDNPLYALMLANTHVGSLENVPFLSGKVRVRFENVTVEGGTFGEMTQIEPGPMPSGYTLIDNIYYDIETTAVHDGWTDVEITYDQELGDAMEQNLKIMNYQENQWVDITYGDVTTGYNRINGRADENWKFDAYPYYAVMILEELILPNTPKGDDVTVTPVTGISLEFDNVSVAGDTVAVLSDSLPEGRNLPDNFMLLGSYYNIYTSAEYDGMITIVMHYDSSSYISRGEEENIKLWHLDENGRWVDVTTYVDTDANIVYGEVSSFSYFAVAVPDTLIHVRVDKHIVGQGTKPIPLKQPLANIEVRLYERSDIEAAGFTPINWQSMPDITASNLTYVSGLTDLNGDVYFGEVPNDYILVATSTAATDYKHLWTPVDAADSSWTTEGADINKYLQLIEKADGSKVPGKSKKYSGSEIIIIEPEYIEWDSETETYPFIMISQDSWGVEVAIEPPAGYEADYPELIETTPEYKAVQFTVTEVGSVPDKTKVKMKLKDPRGKTTKHESKIDVKLSKKLAKEKGVKINKHGGVIDETGVAAFFMEIGRFFKSFSLGR